MIAFKYDNCLLTKKQIFSTAKKLLPEIKKLQNADYNDDRASVLLPEDTKILQVAEAAIALKKKLHPQLIIVVGIGGSNLGTIAIQEAILGRQWNLQNSPKIMYADTVDADSLQEIITEMQQVLRQGQQVIINAVSKSGTTTETIANFEVLLNVLKRHRKDAEKYIVATTDKDSKLWQLAIKNNYSLLEIPKKVGGRYSVLSPVGLFPLGMLGINLKELLKEAEWMKNKCLTTDIKKNPAAIGASIIYLHSKKKNIYNTFLFSTDLESLGKWYRQLLAESTGKTKTCTPTISIGSTDLHSMAQLYFGGPKDKLFNIVTTHNKNTIKIPYYPEFNQLVPNLQKKEINHIMHAIIQGTTKAMKKAKIPYTETKLDTKKATTAFMQLKMIETILLAKLLKVNAFDQPAVEQYKKETKKYLH
ncbi:glucose-6-phosphate isomerase [Candidatus Woesearchaeota archaeon]|nr:glucose-6-phosphate isomerase [Candidatus Woesearchaeota archaeon]